MLRRKTLLKISPKEDNDQALMSGTNGDKSTQVREDLSL